MANNQRRMDALLVAQNIVHNATIDNEKKGIYSSERKMAMHRATDVREQEAQIANAENTYQSAYLDGGIKRAVKGFAGGITRGLGGAVEGAMSLNPYESGAPNSMSASQVEYAKKREQADKDRQDIQVYTEKLKADGFSDEEVASKVSDAIKEYSMMGDRLQADDFKIGKQNLRYNPLVEGARIWEGLIPDANPNPTTFWDGVKDSAHKMSGLSWADSTAKAALELAKRTGPGFDTGMTIDEAIQKQKDNRAKREVFDRDYIATGLKELATGNLDPVKPNEVDRNILGSIANEEYEREFVESRRVNNPSAWHEFSTAIGTYIDDPSKIGSTMGNVAGYTVPVVGGMMMAGDVSDVNFAMNQRMAEKRGTNYLDKADKDRILQATGATAIAMKVGLDQVRGFAGGNGVGKLAVDSLFGKVGGKTAAVLRPIAGVLANGTAEGLQEVTELLTEKWGTYDDATKAELAQSFVDGFVGGAGMSAVGSAAAAVPKGIQAYENRRNGVTQDDLTATTAESLDINNAKYSPSRIINRAAGNMPSGKVDSLAPLQAVKDEADGAYRSAIDNVNRFEEAQERLDRLEFIRNSLASNQLTPEKEAAAEQEYQQLMDEHNASGLKIADIEKGLPIAREALSKAQEAYGKVITTLNDVKDANDIEGEFANNTGEQKEINNPVPSIDQSMFIPSNENFSPDTAITDASNKLSTTQSETDIDAVVDSVDTAVAELREVVKQNKKDNNRLQVLEDKIDEQGRKYNAVDKNLNPEDKAKKQENLLKITNKYKAERDAIKQRTSKVPVDAEAKLKKAENEARKLTNRAFSLKQQRKTEVPKLEAKQELLRDKIFYGRASQSEIDSLADVEMQLEAYRNGTSGVTKSEQAKKKELKRAQHTQQNVNNRIASYNKLKDKIITTEQELAKAEEDVKNASRDTRNMEIDVRDKVKARLDKLNKELAKMNPTQLAKDRDSAQEKLDKAMGVKKPKEKPKAKKTEKVTELEGKIEKYKETIKAYKEEGEDSLAKKAEENLEALEQQLAEEAVKEKEAKEAKKAAARAKPLVNRIKKFLGSPAAANLSPEKKLVLEDIARQFDEATVKENLEKDDKKVYQDILKGGDGFVGLEEYANLVGFAIETKNTKELTRLLTQLNTFLQSHESKSAAMEAGYKVWVDSAPKVENRKPQVVLRKKGSSTEWETRPATTFEKVGLTGALRKSGALLIDARSKGLVKKIKEEAGLIQNKFNILNKLKQEFANLGKVINPLAGNRETPDEVTPTDTQSTDSNTTETSQNAPQGPVASNSNNSTPTPPQGNQRSPVSNQGYQNSINGRTQTELNSLGIFASIDTVGKTDKLYSENGTNLNNIIDIDPVKDTSNLDQDTIPQKEDFKNLAYDYVGGTNVKNEMGRHWAAMDGSARFNPVKLTDPQLKEIEGMAYAANKSIAFGFGNPTTKASLDVASAVADKFSVNNNVSTYHGRGYTADDVVLYVPDTANDTGALAQARKDELDAAMDAGASIYIPMKRATLNKKVDQTIDYMKERGYVEKKSRIPALNTVNKDGMTDAIMFVKPKGRDLKDAVQSAQIVASFPKYANAFSSPVIDDDTILNLSDGNQPGQAPININDDLSGNLFDDIYQGVDISDFYQDEGFYNNQQQEQEIPVEQVIRDEYTKSVKGIENESETGQDAGNVQTDDLLGNLKLTTTNSFTSKDQKKAEQANAYIGFADTGSTKQYLDDATEQGFPTNEGIIANEDTVAFVSINGKGKLTDDNYNKTLEQVIRVLEAGGKIIVDNDYHAFDPKRSYNVGEKRLQTELRTRNYIVVNTKDFNTYYKANVNEESNLIETVSIRNNPNNKVNSLKGQYTVTLNGQEVTRSIEKKDEEWRGINIEPVNIEYKEESGKLNLTPNILKQGGTHLSAQGNLYSKLIATQDWEALAEIIGVDTLSQDQMNQIKSFSRLMNKMLVNAQHIIADPDSSMKTGNNAFYRHLVNKGADGRHYVDENVVLAAAVGVYQYIQQGGRNSYPDDLKLRAVHGIDKNADLISIHKMNLAKLGTHRGLLFQELGSTGIKALGLSIGEDASVMLRHDLEASLGSLAYSLVTYDQSNNPMFVEVNMNHKEQLKMVTSAMYMDEAKNHLKGILFNNGILINGFGEAMSKIKTKEELSNYIDGLRGSYFDTSVNLTRPAIEMHWNSDTKTNTTLFHPEILDIIKSSEKTKGKDDAVDKLFKTDLERKAPLETIPTYDQKTSNKTDTEIPSNTAEMLSASSENQWIIQTDRANAIIKMYQHKPDLVYELMGVMTEEELNDVHPAEQEEKRMDNNVKKELIDQQVNWLMERKDDEGNYRPFYHLPVSWVNQRVGYESTLFNAQTDLFARMLTSMKDWQITIDKDQPLFLENGEVSERGMFLTALAENMEGASKTEAMSAALDERGYDKDSRTVDKVQPEDFLDIFEEYLKTPVVRNAVKAISRQFDPKAEPVTKGEFKAIDAALKEFKMDELGFGALLELAKYEAAEGKYTTDIGLQSDGITNGPMITKFLLAVADPDERLRGGIISGDKNFNNFFETKKAALKDMYQKTGFGMGEELTTYITDTSVLFNIVQGMKDIDDDFGSRSWAKKLLTPFNYGAGTASLKRSIANGYLNEFLKDYYSLYAKQRNGVDITQDLHRINTILDNMVNEYNALFLSNPINKGNYQTEIQKLVYIQNSTKSKADKYIDPNQDTEALFKALMAIKRNAWVAKKRDTTIDRMNGLEWAYRNPNKVRAKKFGKNKWISESNLAEDLPIDLKETILSLAEVSFSTASTKYIDNAEGEFIEIRDSLNDKANQAFDTSRFLENIYIDELVSDNQIDMSQTDFKGMTVNQLDDATRIQEKRFVMTVKQSKAIHNKMKPHRAAVASGMSNLNINEKTSNRIKPNTSGINLETSTTSTRTGQTIRFNNPKKFDNPNEKEARIAPKHIDLGYGYTFKDSEAPGVSALALIVQSLDSAISMLVYGKQAGLNLHDAISMGINGFKGGTKKQNEEFYNAVAKYHIGQEIFRAYMRPFYGMQEVLKDPGVSHKSKKAIVARIRAEQGRQEDFLAELEAAYDQDIAKLKQALEDRIIHQYGGVDGQYTLTAEDKVMVDKEITKLKSAKDYDIKNYTNELIIVDDSITDMSNTEIVDGLLGKDKRDILTKLVTENKMDASSFLNYLKDTSINTLPKEYVDMIMDMLSLNDASLSDIKIVARKISIKSPLDSTKTIPALYHRLSNRILVNPKSQNFLGYALQETAVAVLQQNFKALKNGSLKNKGLTEEYRAIKLLSDNMDNYLQSALDAKLISPNQMASVQSALKGREGDVEFLISHMLYGSEAHKNIFKAIPNITGVAAQNTNAIKENGSIFKAILNFMVGLVLGRPAKANEDGSSLFDLLEGSSRVLVEGVKERRQSSTIAGMENQSMSFDGNRAYEQQFEREYFLPNNSTVNLNGFDTRFQLELHKEKIKSGGSTLTAEKALDIILNTLESGLDTSVPQNAEYADSLTPIVRLLRNTLPKGIEVLLVDNSNDLLNKKFTKSDFNTIEQYANQGKAAFIERDNAKGIVVMFTSNATANPNAKLSDLVHELVHALTTRSLEENPKAKARLVKLRDKIRDGVTKGELQSDIDYALFGDVEGNIDEFVAQIFSKAVVRNYLANYETSLTETADNVFFKQINDVLGVESDNTALSEFAGAFSETMSSAVETNYDPELEAKEPLPLPKDWNTKSLAYREGLNDLGIMENSIVMATQINEFDNTILPEVAMTNANFVISKAIEYAKGKLGKEGIDPDLGVNLPLSDKNYDHLLTMYDGKFIKVTEALAIYTEEFIEGSASAITTLNYNEDYNIITTIIGAINTAKATNGRKILGSNGAANQRVNQEESHHPRDIANFLKQHSTRDNSYLDSLIDKVVDPLVSKIDPALVAGYDYEKVWHDALISGEAVYASRAVDAGFELDDQQGYVLEVIEVALANTLDEVTNTAVYRQLAKSFKQAKAQVNIEDFHDGDWDNTTQEERDIATDKYNLVFSPAVGAADGKSDYLTNFAALAMVSPEMQRVLNFSATREYKDQDIYEKSVALVTRAVEFIEEQSTDSYTGDTISNRVRDLSQELASVYYKNQDKVVEKERDLISRSENVIAELSDKALQAAHKAGVLVANAPVFKDTVAGKITQQVLDGKLAEFDKFANHFMDYVSPNTPLNGARELFNEITGELGQKTHKDIEEGFHVTKAIEQGRGHMIEVTSKAIEDSFSKENENMSPEDAKAITNVGLRPDLQSLMDDMSFNEIVELIKDPSKLNKAIKEMEDNVAKETHGFEYIARAKSLGNYLARRQATDNLLSKNAFGIVERIGLAATPFKGYSAEAETNVDKLASLYALRNTKKSDRKRFSEVLDREASNTNKVNGLEYTLMSHRAIAKQSKGLFAENPYSIAKGYLPNITNPTKGFEVVTEEHVGVYEELGYKRASTLNKSGLDVSTDNRVLMTISNTGKQRYVSGAFSIEDTMKSGAIVVRKGDAEFEAAHRKAVAQFKQATKGHHKNTTLAQDGGYLVPSYDKNGQVISYSYEMSNVGLDSHLERNNNHATLLGQYKGSNISKELYPDNNKKLVDSLIEKHNNANEFDRRKFVLVGPKSTNKRARDYWNSLPLETQLYIKEQNGVDQIFIRNDELNLLFGFRKFNPNTVFDKDVFERNLLESVYAALFELPFRGKAKLRHDQGLALWMDLIKTMKDFVVIRNFKVLWLNIRSNIAFLMLNSTDPVNATKDIKDALMYSLQYQRDMQALNKLKHEMSIGLSTPAMVADFAVKQDDIARNPLAEFISRGMMPMIVNDVSFKKGEVEFDTAFDMIKDKTVGKLPKGVQKSLDVALVAPGTPLYSFLSNATQQSDFVFKYALYKQELRKGKTKDEAIDLARTVFIDYDIPNSKAIQFVNDIGLWMFTKFALRIQRALIHYIKTKPGKLVAEHVISSGVMGNESILSLNIVNSFNGTHPLRNPTVGVLTMYEHALPIQMIGSILK